MPARSAIIATAADWRDDCASLCTAQGVEARLMGNGLDVLLAAIDSVPDVIVYDAGISAVDHQSFCRKLKQQEGLAEVEILLLVDGGTAEAGDACTSLGVRCATSVEALLGMLSSALSRAPAEDAAAGDPVMASPSPAAPDGSRPTQDRPRILIVDDDRHFVRGLEVRLRDFDVDVAAEYGGREALYTALSIKPDVILTDYNMPQGNGEYFLLRLKEEPSLRDVPVIVMTGRSFDGETDVAHERDMLGRCGATVYLRKPIDFSSLLAELTAYVPMQRKVPGAA